MKTSKKLKSFSKSFSSDGSNLSNVTVTLPSIHVTEPTEGGVIDFAELPTEIHYLAVPSERCHFFPLEKDFSGSCDLLSPDDSSYCYFHETKAPEISAEVSKQTFKIETRENCALCEEREVRKVTGSLPGLEKDGSVFKRTRLCSFLPPLPIPSRIPSSLDDALRIVKGRDVMFYLKFKTLPSDIHYEPYDFHVVSSCPGNIYAILSSKGIIRILGEEIEFTTLDRFSLEKQKYMKLRQLPFFRNFRLRRSWIKWRRSIRARKLMEAKKEMSSHFLFANLKARKALSKVAHLCHELSKRCLVKFPVAESDVTGVVPWVEDGISHITDTHSKLTSFRALVLQVLITDLKVYENDEDSEFMSAADQKGSPRSQSGSSGLSRRHLFSLAMKLVRISDVMMAHTLKEILSNSLMMILTSLHKKGTDASESIFRIEVSIAEGSVKCNPNFEGFLNGVRTVMKACEVAVLSCQHLATHFVEKESSSDENKVLRSMLESDSTYKQMAAKLQPLMQGIWKDVEENIEPIRKFYSQVKVYKEEEKERTLTSDDLTGLGDWLSGVGKLLEAVKEVADNMPVGVMWVERASAKTVLVEGLKRQQLLIHQLIIKTFASRSDLLDKQATDAWLGLELSPVTAHQLVSLLNYVIRVKGQMDSLNNEEKIINQIFALMQEYEITIQPEVQAKYDTLCKDMRRLRKTLRRSAIERPGLVTKLKVLLKSEVNDLDKETEKLTEQVQALRFLRITSDRNEVLKMLSAAEKRSISIRSQAKTVTEYQKDFQLDVCPFSELERVEEEVSQKTRLWRSLFEWESFVEECLESEVRNMDAAFIKTKTGEYKQRVLELRKVIEESEVLDHFDYLVKIIENQISILEAMTDPTLRPRHWQELEEATGCLLPETLTFADVERHGLKNHKDVMVSVAKKAQKQKDMEDRLQKVSEDLEKAAVPFKLGYKKDIVYLGDMTDLEDLFVKSDLAFYCLLHSEHAFHIKDEAVTWKNNLILMQKTLESLKMFEERWKLLEPVMGKKSAIDAFPMQVAIFDVANIFWRKTITKLQLDPVLLKQIKGGHLFHETDLYLAQISTLHCCVEPLLAIRRNTCPRLYLLPDEELIHLLTRSQESELCEKYLRMIFSGVSSFQRNSEGNITALVSPEGEILHLTKTVLAHHGVEDWMSRAESGMRATLKRLVLKHFRNNPLSLDAQVPTQVIDLCKRIQWNQTVRKTWERELECPRESGEGTTKELSNVIQGLLQETAMIVRSQNKETSEVMFEAENLLPLGKVLNEKPNVLYTLSEIKSMSTSQKLGVSMAQQLDLYPLEDGQRMNFNDPSLNPRKDEPVKPASCKIQRRQELKARLSYCRNISYISTLLELRDMTQRLMEEKVESSKSFAWMSYPKHRITSWNSEDGNLLTESSGRVGVVVEVGTEIMDYGFEYYGVPQPTLFSSHTNRMSFNLIAAATRSKCGTIVGPAGSGKTETILGLAKVLGQHLSVFRCSCQTPAKSICQLLSAGVQGGLWVLLKEPQTLANSTLENLVQSLINIQRTRDTSNKRCIVEGQEMRLMDSFALFFSLTDDRNNGAETKAEVNRFFRHPITPFLKAMPSSLPTEETVIEALTLASGFTLSAKFRDKMKTILAKTSSKPFNVILASSYIKSTKIITALAKRSQDQLLEQLQPMGALTVSDESFVAKSTRDFLLPLIDPKLVEEWKEVFDAHLGPLECLENQCTGGKTEDHKPTQEIASLEVITRKLLLTLGYRNVKNVTEFQKKSVPNSSENVLHMNGYQIYEENEINNKEFVSEFSDTIKNGEESFLNTDADDVGRKPICISEGLDTFNKPDLLCPKGRLLLDNVLRLNNILQTHKCCCVAGSQVLLKFPIWMILKMARNAMNNPSLMEKLSLSDQNPTLLKGDVSNIQSKTIIRSFVLHCGAYSSPQMVGTNREDSDGWNTGILFKILKDMTEESRSDINVEQWLILSGPFSSPVVLDSILSLCPPSNSFKDQGFYEIIFPRSLRIIIEIEEESAFERYISRRVPILRFKDAPEDPKDLFLKHMADVFGDKISDECRAISPRIDAVIHNYITHPSMNVPVKHTAIANAFERARTLRPDKANEQEEMVNQVIESVESTLKFIVDCRAELYPFDQYSNESSGENEKQLNYFVTSEMTACSSAIRFILNNFSSGIILLSYPGEGLTTLLDFLYSRLRDNFEIYEFKIPSIASCEKFVEFAIENLDSRHLHLSSEESVEDMEDYLLQCSKTFVDYSDGETILAPSQDKEGLLVVDGFQQMSDGNFSSTFTQVLRSLLKCQILIDPKTRRRYRVERLRLLLNMRYPFHGKLDDRLLPFEGRLLTQDFFKYCWVVSLPKASRALKLRLIQSELEKVSTEIQEERQIFGPLVESVVKLHEIVSLSKPSSPLDKKERTFCNRIKCLLSRKSHPFSNVDSQSFDNSFSNLLYVENEEEAASEVWCSSSSHEAHYSSRPFAANLTHLVRFIKALSRNKKLFTYTLAEIGFIFCTEARQIYNFVSMETSFLREILEHIYTKFFEEKPETNNFLVPKWLDDCMENCLEKTYEGMAHLFRVSDKDFGHLLISKGILRVIESITLYLTESKGGTHLILEGETGVGKTLLLQLSLRYISYDSYNLNEAKSESSQIEMLREAVIRAGIEGKATAVISRMEFLGENTFLHIYSLVNYGWSEGLWPKYLVRGILFSMKENMNDQNYISYIDEKDFSVLRRYLLQNIQRNLYICLCGTRKDVSHLLENHSSLARKCSFVHIENWTTETLREIAENILEPCDISQNTMKNALMFLPQVHQSFKRGFKEQRRRRPMEMTTDLYAVAEEGDEENEREEDADSYFHLKEIEVQGVTEQDYLECCNVFVWLMKRRKTDLKNKLSIYKDGLLRLESTSENIEDLRSELGQLEPHLKTTQEEAQRLTSDIGHQRNIVADLRSQMTAHEGKLKEKSDAIASLNEEISNEIKEALPDLESAEKQIKVLDKKDLVEVRVLNKPPDLVFQVMSAICLLLNVKAEWPAIKTLLGEPTLAKRLLELEKDSLNDVTLRKLRKFIEYPKFTPDEVGKLSKPCRPLCAWLRALDNYCQTLKNVEPKRGRVIEAERVLNNLLVEQRQLQQKLGQAERTLSEQGARYDACVCRRQQLEGAVKRASGRLQRCTRLATVLADEHTRWQKLVKTFEDQLSCIYGECLLAAIVVAYLGYLSPMEREEALASCVDLMQSSNLKVHRKNFNLLESLSTLDERKKWISVGLHNNPIPLIQASILMASQRHPLVLDVHQCLMPWLSRLHEGSFSLVALHAGQKDFLKILVDSVKSNKITVVLHTPLKCLDPQIKMALNLIRKEMKTKGSFEASRLIFVSGSSSDIPIDLRVYVTPVSFAMAPKVLEERLLNEVFKRERPDLFDQRTTLSTLVQKDEDALHGVEMSILKRLTETTLGLLDNEELLAVFYEAKMTSAEYRTRLAESKRSLQKIGNARDKYRPVAARGRVLFSVVGALQRLSREYVFSLRFFLKIFDECIKAGGDEEITMSFDQRIETLVLTLTQKICTHVKRAVDSNHRLVFLAALTASVSYEEGDLSMCTWKALMKKDVTHKETFLKKVGQTEEEIKLTQEMLTQGATLQLSLHDLQMDISEVSAKGIPSFVPKKISDFNILLLLRFYKPRMLLLGTQEVIKNVLHDASIIEINSSLDEMLDPRDRTSGILLWTDYSDDLIQQVSEWAGAKGIEGMVRTFVGSSEKTCSKEIGTCDIPSAIQSAIRLGGAIVIQNCASLSWSPGLLDQITSITTTNTKVHEDFRLIFSTRKGEAMNYDLILLTRPLQTIPSSDLCGILSESAKKINMEIYEHHYEGATWRKIVWMAAAVHSVVYVNQFWNICSQFNPPDPEKDTFNRLATPSEFNQWVKLKDIELTFDILYKYSLNGYLTEECAVSILECLYGRKDLWVNLTTTESTQKTKVYEPNSCHIVSNGLTDAHEYKPKGDQRGIGGLTIEQKMNIGKKIALPQNVGIVTKAAAHRMVLMFLISEFPDLHHSIMDKEFNAFKMDFAKISSEILKQ